MKSNYSLKISYVQIAIVSILILGATSCNEDDPLERDKFLGSYLVSRVCVLDADAYFTATITAGSGENGIIFTTTSSFSYSLTGTVSGSGLTIPQQMIGGGGDNFLITGTGTLSGNTLTIIVQVVIMDGGETDQCTLICTKQ